MQKLPLDPFTCQAGLTKAAWLEMGLIYSLQKSDGWHFWYPIK